MNAKIGVIGGSGLYQIENLQHIIEVDINTPFGKPSDKIITGTLKGIPVAFLPRHGRGHKIMPTEVPFRANIFALKSLGVEYVLSISAVGSLNESIQPLDLVIPDQLIDRTRSRINTFFGNGLVVHISFAEPFCPILSTLLYETIKELGIRVHKGGTYIAMEGPAFSTRAESLLYRSWGASVIGMTALPEAKLAKEAEMCYATIACVTDYDCWHETEGPVNVEMIVTNLLKNAENAKKIITTLIGRIPPKRDCSCATTLKNAIITAPEVIPDQIKRDLGLLINKYVQ